MSEKKTDDAALDDTLAPTSPPTPSSLGDVLRDAGVERLRPVPRDSYQLLGEMARGGLGRIFRARDERTGRPVAIKEVLRPDGDILVRFAREALVTANLMHPSIVPVYEVGRWPDGEPFYAMKLVRGRSLEDVIAETRSTAARVALLPHVIDVAEALAYAHGERIIHRDLKPANVLVGAYGETVVIDWGLAKNLATGVELAALPRTSARAATDASSTATVAGSVLGTPAYMPPEQARGETVDERADVYALGAILYHALAGARPYAEGRNAQEVLDRVAQGPPRPLRELAPDVPEELFDIVDKALARDAAQRYATAKGLADDLRAFQAGKLVGAHRYSPWELVRRWLRRHRAAVATAALALLALAAFGVYSFARISRERTLAVAARRLAEERLGQGLEELGRQALLDGEPERALPQLDGALAAWPEATASLPFLLGQARAAYRDLELAVPSPNGTVTAELDAAGTRLVTAGSKRVLTVWDVATGAKRWSRPDPWRARLSPDDRWIAAAMGDHHLQLFSLEDGAAGPAVALPADDSVVSLVWSRDGKRVAAGGVEGNVGVLAVGGGTPVVAKVQAARVRDLAFGPAGLATTGEDGAVNLVDSSTLKPLRSLPGHTGGASAVVWLADGHLLSGGADGEAVIWDVATGAPVRRFALGAALYSLAVDEKRGLLATSGVASPVVKLWDLASGAARGELAGHQGGANGLAFFDDGLATSDEKGVVRLWDLARAEVVRTLPVDGSVWALGARAGRVIVAGNGTRTRVWRSPSPSIERLAGHGDRVRRLVVDHGLLYSVSLDGKALGWDAATGARRFAADAGKPLSWIEPSPDGKLLLLGCEDGELSLWDASGARRGVWRGHQGRLWAARFTADGGTVFSAAADGTVRRWDVARGVETGRIQVVTGDAVDGLALARGLLVTRTQAGAVAVWDPATLQRAGGGPALESRMGTLVVAPDGQLVLGPTHALVLADPAGGAPARAIELTLPFSADVTLDGRSVAAGNAGGEVAVYDFATGAQHSGWRVDDNFVVVVRFRPDGAVLATSSVDRGVKLWDAATGRLLASAPRVSGVATQLSWTPDGRRLAIAGVSGDVWLWDLTPAGAPDPRLVSCAAPWRLDGGRLAPAVPDAGCRP